MTFVIPIIIMPLLFTFIFSSVSDMAAPSEDNRYKIVLDCDGPQIVQLFENAGIYELVKSDDPINAAYEGEITAYISANGINQALLENKIPTIDFIL